MISWADELHQAIFDALDGDAGVGGALTGTPATGTGRIHSGRAPQQAPFPHITIGGQDSFDRATHDKTGGEVFVSVELWSRQSGWKEANLLRKEVERVLGEQTIQLANFTALTYVPDVEYLPEKEENLKHINLDFRTLVSED